MPVSRKLGIGLTIIAAATLSAQTVTSEAKGKVTDANGAPVAGAVITLSSGQATFTITSGEDGTFRRGLLNPGAWTVTVSKKGYVTYKAPITLAQGSSQLLNVKLAKDDARATVEVVGAPPTIDTSTTTVGLNTSLQTLSSIPVSRDMTNLAFLAPGVVDDGGFGNPSIAGASGAENKYYVDGLQTTDFRTGFQGASLPTDFIDQVSVQSGALTPEYSALGGVISASSKGGTNEFKGEIFGYWQPKSWIAKPKSNAPFFKAGENQSAYDYGFDLGGAIVKDKLFFFVGLDSVPFNGPGTTNLDPGLTGSASSVTNLKPFLKLNWFLTQDQQLTATYYGERYKFDQGQRYPNRGTAQFGFSEKDNTDLFNLAYDWTIANDLQFSAKFGSSKLSQTQSPTDTADTYVDDGAFYPTGPFAGLDYASGGFGGWTSVNENKTTQYAASLSWFPAHHSVKVGIDALNAKYQLYTPTSGAGYTLGVSGDGLTLTQTFYKDDATVETHFLGLYAQDFWEVSPGMKVGYGARWQKQTLYDANGASILSFNDVKNAFEPYLGFIWDQFNDGKSKLSVTYRSYHEAIPQRLQMRVFGHEDYFLYYYGTNFAYDPTVANHWGALTGGAQLATGPYQSYAALGADSANDYSTPFSHDPIAKGLRLPERHEIVIGYDRQLDEHHTMGIHGRYRRLEHVIEDSVITDPFGTPYDSGAATVPGDPTSAYGQAILWNPGGSVSWTANQFSTTPGSYNVPNTLFPKAYNEYKAVDLTWEYKSARLYSNMSYTWSRLYGNYEGLVSSSNGQPDANITASFDYYPYVGTGLLPLDRTHQLKWYGTYTQPIGSDQLHLGWNFSLQSGTPISAFDDGSLTNGHTPGYDDSHTATVGGHTVVDNGNGTYSPFLDIGYYGGAVPDHGQYGNHGRTATTYNLDLKVDYYMTLPNKMLLIPAIDIFNATNSRKQTGVYQVATLDNVGTPNPAVVDPNTGNLNFQSNGFQGGRSLRFSVKLKF
jgi:hypothetical protein